MQINSDVANQIKDKAKAILQRDVLVAATDGNILADRGQRLQFAPDALRAAQEGRQIDSTLDGKPIKWCPFVYDKRTVGSFGIMTDQPMTPEALSLLQGLAEVIVHQHFLLDRIQSSEVMRNNFINEVLTASNINPTEIYRQADILQLNLQTPQAVFLISLHGFESKLHATLSQLSPEEQRLELSRATEHVAGQIKSGFKNFQGNIVSYMGNDTFVLLKSIGGDNLNTLNTIRFLNDKAEYVFNLLKESQHSLTITLGVGQYYPDLGGLRKSFQDAKLALEVGSKVWGRGQVYHIKHVGMFVTLAHISQERKAELAHQILNPLLRDQQLFKTVQAFLASGLNLTEAANKLHVHRNTLIYRLDKTKKLISLDPRHFDDALQIKLGLMFY